MSINLRQHKINSIIRNESKFGYSISPIQYKMMKFYKDNRRCVINAPRQSGKSTFLIMQALLSNNDTIIIHDTLNMAKLNKTEMHNFCLINNIQHKVFSTHILLEKTNTIVKFITKNEAISNLYGYSGNVFIDEYQFIDINKFNLSKIDYCIMIGTHKLNEYEFEPDGNGLFAGLNITEG